MRGRLTPAAVRSLHSATVGVVGLGQIGLAVATLFRAAGAQVGYSDPAPRDPAAAGALGLGRLDLGALLAGSDVVTLHVPLVPATRGLIGGAELRRMRPGAILVNASRGGVVDEAALAAHDPARARAVARRHIRGTRRAALNRVAEERQRPVPPG